jgi:hypothetical protein
LTFSSGQAEKGDNQKMADRFESTALLLLFFEMGLFGRIPFVCIFRHVKIAPATGNKNLHVHKPSYIYCISFHVFSPKLSH